MLRGFFTFLNAVLKKFYVGKFCVSLINDPNYRLSQTLCNDGVEPYFSGDDDFVFGLWPSCLWLSFISLLSVGHLCFLELMRSGLSHELLI